MLGKDDVAGEEAPGQAVGEVEGEVGEALPGPGIRFQPGGVEFEVLEADPRRAKRLRVRALQPALPAAH